jgi:hypothetical protein
MGRIHLLVTTIYIRPKEKKIIPLTIDFEKKTLLLLLGRLLNIPFKNSEYVT